MESENVVLCPVHGGSLCISPKIITFLGTHYNALEGKCPQCRVVYLDQKIKGIARFTYEGTNYQYLPELENWRVKQEQKKEEERKKFEAKKNLSKKYAFLNIGALKIRVHPNRADHCPEHGSKVGRLSCQLQNELNVELIKLEGCYCSQCNALYLDKKLKDTMETYSDSANLNVKIYGDVWNDFPPVKVAKIQFPIKRKPEEIRKQIKEQKEEMKRKKAERERKVAEEEKQKMEIKYPFLKIGEIKIQTVVNDPSHCIVHQKLLEVIRCRLKDHDQKREYEFTGHYCQMCNCLYQKRSVEKKLINYMGIGKQPVECTLIPIGNEWKNVPMIKVSELKLLSSNNGKDNRSQKKIIKCEPQYMNAEVEKSDSFDEKFFKIMAYQKFDREVAEILVTVDGQETFIRILTSVKDIDKYKCVQNELLIRESESTGRELLGRIAHDQLDKFASKIGTIKIHNYKVWPGQEHHLDGFTRFCDPENIQNITVMSQNNISRDSDEYEMVTALVYCANRVEPVYIDVYYSKRQNKYFINEESYRQYRMRYGLPYVHLVADEYDGDMDYGNLRKNSELNLYGYTVAKTAEMSTGERQRLLQQLMDNGLMSKHQIVNHLEWLIHRQSGRVKMEDACDCWREDLRFVNSYRLNAQRKIQGRFVYGKTVLR